MRAKPILTIVLAIGLLFGGSGGIAWGLNRDPNPPPTDYWQKLGFLNIAHQGGEQEAPGNTLFAYKTSLRYRGADMIDMDAYMTSDNQIVLTHDLDASNTSNAPGGTKISEHTLAELRQFDFGYWFTPWYGTYYNHGDAGKPHPYRGIATGAVEPPEGFTADDFRIATFDQVLDEFPTTPINIELKSVVGVDINATAAAAAAALARHPGREKDVIINSFGQAMMDAFHAAAPNHLAFSASEEATLGYLSGTPVTPTPVSLQPPDYYDLNGGWLRTVPVLRTPARFDGYSLIIWGSDHDPLQDTAPYYRQLITEGANGINTTRPGQLNQYLCEAGVPRPDGTARCESQECPPPSIGVRPRCRTVEPASQVQSVRLSPGRVTIRAGRRGYVWLRVRVTPGMGLPRVKVRLRSSNRRVRLPRSVQVDPYRKATRIRIRADRKARGSSLITATAEGKRDRAMVVVIPR
ncbi:MAG: hypothetical protein M9938_00470 [Solirubrobacterales bacterium]|nr:hypothetical protein [Solirubrobacterales bacterium]